MLDIRLFAGFTAGLVALIALMLVVDRSGFIAWFALIVALGLLLKIWKKPAARDPLYVLMLVLITALLMVGTRHYVISVWESGEVIELAIETGERTQTARLWVMDIAAQPVVYYDAGPQAANALLSGRPVEFTRAGVTSTRLPSVSRVDDLNADEATVILDAMAAKYGDRNDAAIIYYGMLGRASDRVALVIKLGPNVSSPMTQPD